MSEINNGWGEWSRHVLAELSRLNEGQEALRLDIQQIKMDIASINALDYKKLEAEVADLKADLKATERTISQPDGMLDRDKDFENRLRTLETSKDTNAGKFSIIAIAATPIIAAVVSLLIGLMNK